MKRPNGFFFLREQKCGRWPGKKKYTLQALLHGYELSILNGQIYKQTKKHNSLWHDILNSD